MKMLDVFSNVTSNDSVFLQKNDYINPKLRVNTISPFGSCCQGDPLSSGISS
jgi:hypothetical protein